MNVLDSSKPTGSYHYVELSPNVSIVTRNSNLYYVDMYVYLYVSMDSSKTNLIYHILKVSKQTQTEYIYPNTWIWMGQIQAFVLSLFHFCFYSMLISEILRLSWLQLCTQHKHDICANLNMSLPASKWLRIFKKNVHPFLEWKYDWKWLWSIQISVTFSILSPNKSVTYKGW